jgi:hypothetical protein
MMAGADHSAWKFRDAPLFTEACAPYKRAGLGGYEVGDLVWLTQLGYPGQRRPAKVINILHKCHVLVLRAENPASIVDLNPLVHPALISKRTGVTS